MRYLPSLAFLLLSLPGTAQNVTGFLDYMDRLIVFDSGTFSQIEPRKPNKIMVGGNYLAYTDNRDDLKVYRNGRTTVVDQASELDPIVTDHLLGFTLAGILKVWDGSVRMLSPNVGQFIVEDSLAVFKDQVQGALFVYYRGERMMLEDQLAGNAVVQWKTGDNIVAWVSAYDRKLKVFYHGDVVELNDLVTEVDMKCGLDVVAYRDPYDNTFKAFHKGLIYDLEDQMPHRYEVGKGLVVWLDLTGSLKVLEDGRIHTVMKYEPQRWEVVDSLVVMEDRGAFNVFNRGRSHELSRVVPAKWHASWGTLAYVDVDRSLKVWSRGRSEVVLMGQPVQEFRVDRGLVIARQNIRTARIWWRGSLYDH
jgi:hypothetical protein